MVRRWAFNILAGVSLVLLAGMAVLWVRSWGVGEAVQIGYWRFHPHPDAASAVGGESVSIKRFRGQTEVVRMRHVCVGNPAQYRRGPGASGERWVYRRLGEGELPPAGQGLLAGGRGRLGFFYREHQLRGRQRSQTLYVPDWALMGLMAVAPVCWVVARLLGRRRKGLGLCVDCGYDLRGTPNRCPECGRVVAGLR